MSIYDDRHARFHRTGHRIPEKAWYTHKEVEVILGVKRMTVHRAIHAGALAAEQIGGIHRAGKWRISHAALIAFIEAGQKRAR